MELPNHRERGSHVIATRISCQVGFDNGITIIIDVFRHALQRHSPLSY
jgi:hypothetical protein